MEVEQALRRTLAVVIGGEDVARLDRALAILRPGPVATLVADRGASENIARLCVRAGVERLAIDPASSFARAVNAGAAVARARGAEFLFVLDASLVCDPETPGKLVSALLDDPALGVAGPARRVRDPSTGEVRLARRSLWRLDRMACEDDFAEPDVSVERLEADFCPLECAAIRLAALDRTGPVDENYPSGLASVELGFRLRAAGWTAASFPLARADADSPPAPAPTSREWGLFRQSHLGFGVRHRENRSGDPSSWTIIERNLHPALLRFGLVNPARPALTLNHPGGRPFDYLYTVWETGRLPQRWLRRALDYRSVMVPSRWNQRVFREAGYRRVDYVPLGVETDVFHPWGEAARPGSAPTFLWFARNQRRKALDAMLLAWARVHARHPGARLVVMGNGVLDALPDGPRRARTTGNFKIADFPDDGLSLREVVAPMAEPQLAAIYRSVDFVVCSSRSEGFGFVVAEAMACGTLPVFPDYGATGEFAVEGSLTFGGTPSPADYSDKHYRFVGNWWEPDVESLVRAMDRAMSLDAGERRALVARGLGLIRRQFTWRDTCRHLRAALAELQERDISSPGLVREAAAHARAAGQTLLAGAATAREFIQDSSAAGARSFATIERRLASQISGRGPKKPGVLFVGYAEAGLGLGESFRNMIDSVAGGDLPFAIHPFNIHVEDRRIGPFRPERYDLDGAYEINVFEMAANELPFALRALGGRRVATSHNVLRTYWELPEAPAGWARKLGKIDEIWAPDEFVAAAFERIFPGPIEIVPPRISVERAGHFDRSRFGLAPDRFYFVFSFDFFSKPARKNPLGVLRAFADAFPRGDENVGLVVKSTGGRFHGGEARAAMEEACLRDSRIVAIDETLDRDAMLGLLACCDCYVSLHRGEGFGFGMAEAMALGVPVVGTDFSGNTGFLTPATGFPVPFSLRRLGKGDYFSGAGQVWAEPDPAVAARVLREVRDGEEERRRRALAGKALIARDHGAGAVAAAVTGRIAAIRSRTGNPVAKK